MAQNLGIQALGMILQRHCIDTGSIERGDYGLFAHVTEQRDLGAFIFRQRILAAAQQNVGLNPQAGQLADRMLGWLGFEFAGSLDVGHQRYMNRAGPLAAQLVAELAERFDKREAFDVAHCPANLTQDKV